MHVDIRSSASTSARDEYVRPELHRHGDIDELTRGQGGSVPDSAAAGSTLPPPTPIP